jgi:hypothetical protein
MGIHLHGKLSAAAVALPASPRHDYPGAVLR